jgi:glycosyltransferase involved in cell wall biosynthesis
MRKLLIIAYAFPPFPAPGSARPWRFYKYLPEFGYETYVLTATRPEKLWPRVTFTPAPGVSVSERVLRKFLFPVDDDVLWTRPAIAAGRRLLADTPMDAMLSTIPPIHGHTVAYALKKKTGVRWIADYRDPTVGSPFRPSEGLPGWIDRTMEKHFFKAADLLLTVTDYVRQEFIQRWPEVESKTAILWNGFDPEEDIGPRSIPNRPYRVLAHFGSLYGGRTPVLPMASIDRLIGRGLIDPGRLRLRLIGSIEPAILEKHRQLFDRLTEKGCLECLPPQPRAQALQAMMEADQLLLADNNDSGIGQTVPAKLFEYVRVGRPILALTTAGSPVERILTGSGVPFVGLAPQMSEPAIDARMIEFLDMPSDPVQVSARFSSEFDGRKQAETLARLIDAMLERKKPL